MRALAILTLLAAPTNAIAGSVLDAHLDKPTPKSWQASEEVDAGWSLVSKVAIDYHEGDTFGDETPSVAAFAMTKYALPVKGQVQPYAEFGFGYGYVMAEEGAAGAVGFSGAVGVNLELDSRTSLFFAGEQTRFADGDLTGENIDLSDASFKIGFTRSLN